MQPTLPLILCFGDSLTAGFQSPSTENPNAIAAPYGRVLEEFLRDRAVVLISGICGERTGEMLDRFRRVVVEPKPTFAVILGGTNDLGWDISPDRVVRNLQMMFALASAGGIQPIAVTVPSIRGLDRYIPGRRELNKLLTQLCSREKIPCVDLFTATAEAGTGRLAAEYSNDGLHLTTAGYRLIAALLYEQVFKHLL
jgi:acyl-CoA thioesterase-1